MTPTATIDRPREAQAAPSSRLDSPIPALRLIVRAVMIENLRRREFYVALILMGLFLTGALIAMAAGIQNQATATFLLNLGLTLASLSAHAIALLSAARQMPDELERGTLYPLLAKPVSRGQLLRGKWMAAWLSGVATLLLLLPIAMLPAAKAGGASGLLFAELLLLQALSLAMISALAIAGSLVLPKAVNVVVLALLVGAGGTLINFIRAYSAGKPWDAAVRWTTGYLPDFSRLDLLAYYTAGGEAVSFFDLGLRLFHAAAFIAFPLALAGFLLNRRSL